MGDEAVPIRLTEAAFESIAKLRNLKVLSVNNGDHQREGVASTWVHFRS